MKITPALAVVLTAALASACTLVGESDNGKSARTSSKVVLVTHESFVLPDELVAQFEEETGLGLVVRASSDAGTLTNKLVLTKGSPTGDVAFGVDNTFASRALDEGVFAEYAATLPEGADRFALEGDGATRLTPVDQGNVCVNIDKVWFADRDVAPPTSLDDLTQPEYENLFVTPGATTSSPGLAFLLATIAEYGDDWPDYWSRLVDNGARITAGWSDAYQVDFTQGGGAGDRPIVVSYDSSPAFTVNDAGTRSTTRALLATCFQQVEYAGVLEGAANPEGAGELIDFLVGDDVQAALPESMYVFPVSSAVELPESWARHATQPATSYEVDMDELADNRDDWLREWSDVTSR